MRSSGGGRVVDEIMRAYVRTRRKARQYSKKGKRYACFVKCLRAMADGYFHAAKIAAS